MRSICTTFRSAFAALRKIPSAREAFMDSHTFQDAVLRNLQTLSGATQRISEEAKSSFPDVDWRTIAAFRNVLVHNYLVSTWRRCGKAWKGTSQNSSASSRRCWSVVHPLQNSRRVASSPSQPRPSPFHSNLSNPPFGATCGSSDCYE